MQVDITALQPFGNEPVHTQAPEGLTVAEMLFGGPVPERLPYAIDVWCDGRPIPTDSLEIFCKEIPITTYHSNSPN